MKIYQENKEKIEDYLFIITVLIFVISTIANAPHMFSPAGEATLWGAICSYSYLAKMCSIICIDCRSRGCSMTTYKRLDLLFSKRGIRPDQIEAFLIRCLYSDKLNLRS